MRPGAFDQRWRQSRGDVLVFSGEELSSPLVVAGSPRLDIPVETPAEDTPVVATLVELERGGQVWNISDGFGLVDPATRVASFDLGPICHQFSPGSRVGLDIAFAADVRVGPAVAGSCFIELERGPGWLTLPVIA